MIMMTAEYNSCSSYVSVSTTDCTTNTVPGTDTDNSRCDPVYESSGQIIPIATATNDPTVYVQIPIF